MNDSSTTQLTPTSSLATASLAIEARSLSKIYREGILFGKTFTALKNVSFDVRQGEVFGLLGPNGAGKTTFIKILLGIIRRTDGDATMMGQPAGSRAGRRLVGYLPEHLRIPPHLNGYTALECYGNLSNVPSHRVREKSDHLLELVGLASRAKDRCKKYSKGMLQRLGLAQALLHDPKLLILDEPTDGLDPQARAEMRQIIRRLADDGVTIFLNSHLLQEVEMICHRVAILDRGELRYSGGVKEIGEFVKKATGGATEGLLIFMELTGDVAAVNEALTDHMFAIVGRTGTDTVSIKLSVADQQAVDVLVDRLRQFSISIRGLARQTVSLEDAFLQLVANQSSESIVGTRMDKLKS